MAMCGRYSMVGAMVPDGADEVRYLRGWIARVESPARRRNKRRAAVPCSCSASSQLQLNTICVGGVGLEASGGDGRTGLMAAP